MQKVDPIFAQDGDNVLAVAPDNTLMRIGVQGGSFMQLVKRIEALEAELAALKRQEQ